MGQHCLKSESAHRISIFFTRSHLSKGLDCPIGDKYFVPSEAFVAGRSRCYLPLDFSGKELYLTIIYSYYCCSRCLSSCISIQHLAYPCISYVFNKPFNKSTRQSIPSFNEQSCILDHDRLFP